jgi:dTDP-4-dehydrorhamnose reductase
MKLLIIGASGLIGSHLLRAATASGHDAVGTYRNFPRPGLARWDGADEPALAALLRAPQPDAVVHAAGWTWVDGCEDDPARAFEENARQPERLARHCHERGIRVAYVSTSYIFDGAQGPYDEAATPNPLGIYARSKWEGEQRVQAACGGAALLPRVICVYGVEAQRKNFAYQVGRAFAAGGTLRIPSDQRGNPTYAADVARWLIALLERGERGVWNLAGPFPDCTRPQWTEMLVQAFEACGLARHRTFAVEAVPTAVLKQKAPRPLHAGMTAHKLATLNLPPTAFDESVRQMIEQDPEGFAARR